jgi:hypothetical protein
LLVFQIHYIPYVIKRRTVGDIFSLVTNPDRKKPFDIRTLMAAVSDQDHPALERWAGMADADMSVATGDFFFDAAIPAS